MELALMTLILGGGISLSSSLITAAVQNWTAEQRRRRERAEHREDTEEAKGLGTIRECLDLTTELIGQANADFRSSDVKFDPHLIARAKVAALLIPDRDTRDLATGAFGDIEGYRLAIARKALYDDGPESRTYQLNSLRWLSHVLAAVLRGEDQPAVVVERMREQHRKVSNAWNAEIARQIEVFDGDHE